MLDPDALPDTRSAVSPTDNGTPLPDAGRDRSTAPLLLDVKGLKKYFPLKRSWLRRSTQHAYVKAVDGVDLYIREGETLGLVGESGCGKTTAGRVILRGIEPTAGSVVFGMNGQAVDVTRLRGEELRHFRRHMQMIFQDPYSSLSPRMTVRDIITEPLRAHGIASGSELNDRVRELVRQVGLDVRHLRRYPHAFSGGQRQRIGIARALALRPKLIVADEPVSALDVSVQAQILNLLMDLQEQFHLTYLFISHDLSVVEHVSDRVAVMYVGKVVELAPKEELFHQPLHPYTEALLSAVPVADPERPSRRILLQGEVPDAVNPPSGCTFHPRCKYVQEICKTETPALRELKAGHLAACHFAGELNLQPVTV